MSRAAALVLALACSAADATTTTVEQPRAFGHLLGDLLAQRVLLQQDGSAVEPAALPPADRVGLWLERRPPQLESDAEGRRWLRIEYQVINSPRTLMTITLPALAIATDRGATLAVPEWPLSIGPLMPAGAAQMRPDRPVAALPTVPIERQLRQSVLALAAVLLAWLGWWAWRQRRESRRLPFALAWRELRRLDHGSAGAWLALHRAVDASAGHVVRGATLPRLFAHAPHLRTLQPQLEEFYRRSDQRFFAGDAVGAFALRDLVRALRDAERRRQG